MNKDRSTINWHLDEIRRWRLAVDLLDSLPARDSTIDRVLEDQWMTTISPLLELVDKHGWTRSDNIVWTAKALEQCLASRDDVKPVTEDDMYLVFY